MPGAVTRLRRSRIRATRWARSAPSHMRTRGNLTQEAGDGVGRIAILPVVACGHAGLSLLMTGAAPRASPLPLPDDPRGVIYITSNLDPPCGALQALARGCVHGCHTPHRGDADAISPVHIGQRRQCAPGRRCCCAGCRQHPVALRIVRRTCSRRTRQHVGELSRRVEHVAGEQRLPRVPPEASMHAQYAASSGVGQHRVLLELLRPVLDGVAGPAQHLAH